MKGLPLLVSLIIATGIWWACSLIFGSILFPTPVAVFHELLDLASTRATWVTLSITVARGFLGLLMALVCALLFGVAAGRSKTVMELLTPLVAALQSCPPIIWITLLMVWAGSGSSVTIAVVFATVFPPLFANIAQGCLALDKRLFDMTRLYRVPKIRVLLKIVLPGMSPYLLAGMSYAASACWKVTAVAEFLSSPNGIGAQIYWSYRMLELTKLFAWATIVILLGVILELTCIAPLRKSAESFTSNIREQA